MDGLAEQKITHLWPDPNPNRRCRPKPYLSSADTANNRSVFVCMCVQEKRYTLAQNEYVGEGNKHAPKDFLVNTRITHCALIPDTVKSMFRHDVGSNATLGSNYYPARRPFSGRKLPR